MMEKRFEELKGKSVNKDQNFGSYSNDNDLVLKRGASKDGEDLRDVFQRNFQRIVLDSWVTDHISNSSLNCTKIWFYPPF